MMNHVINNLENKMKSTMNQIGFSIEEVILNPSNRPDLSDYQYNGAMTLAKIYHDNPMNIAEKIVESIKDFTEFKEVNVASPGFINIKLSDEFLIDFANSSLENLTSNYNLGINKTIFLDYGGPNVAKVLHVGHLRSGNIGQALNNLCKCVGATTISDIHLGDWGRPMGMVILEIKTRHPELAYFKEDYAGEEVDFNLTNDDLIELYPTATTKAKENDLIMEEARKINLELQNKHKGYYALWKKIVEVSVNEVKRLYKELNIDFNLWEGESDNFEYMNELFEYLYNQDIITKSEGAEVIEIKEEQDKIDMPPLILVKSNGAVSYEATDLAAIWERVKKFNFDEIWYIVDKRQDLHFTQVFRAAYKSGIVKDIKLEFNGFGTMNGPDGKPFKTRDGGVMRLETLISDINKAVFNKMMENREIDEQEALETSKIVGLSALKYGDLSNQASKDYVFDLDRFTSFEGNTGPYILYTIVRIKSILRKYMEAHNTIEGLKLNKTLAPTEKQLMLEISKFNAMIDNAYEELAPHKICAYIYDLANAFNSFYHENKIMSQEDARKQEGFVALLVATKKALELSIDILGIKAPDRM